VAGACRESIGSFATSGPRERCGAWVGSSSLQFLELVLVNATTTVAMARDTTSPINPRDLSVPQNEKADAPLTANEADSALRPPAGKRLGAIMGRVHGTCLMLKYSSS
jgi:hypothetical protein